MAQIAKFARNYWKIAAVSVVFISLLATATTYAARPAQDEEDDISVSSSIVTARKRPCYGYGCDNVSPYVRIISPTTSPVSGKVLVAADAKDNVRVSQVLFAIDGAIVKADSSMPYSFEWNTGRVGVGWHVITATAYDSSGNSATDTVWTFVKNGICYGYGCPVKK